MASRVPSLAVAVAVAVMCAGASPLFAQTEKRKAKKHLRDGDRALKRGDRLRDRGKEEQAIEQYEAAITKYKAAYELVPNPKIYFPIAQVEERLGLDLDALAHYQQILAEASTLDDNFRAQIEVQIDTLEQRLVVLTIVVEPVGATIAVDGKELGMAPLAKPVPLIPGEHSIEVTMDGHEDYERTTEYDIGKATEEIVLEKTIVAEPVVVAEPPPPPQPKPAARPGRTRLIAGIATTGGLAGAALVTGVLASGKHGDFEDTNLSAGERESARDSGKNLALLTDVLWVGAVGVGAYTAYYYYADYKPHQERARNRAARRPAAWVSPFATGDTSGVVVGGSF